MCCKLGEAHTDKEAFSNVTWTQASLLISIGWPTFLNFGDQRLCRTRSYRVYDPAYEDYHVWDSNEGVYYQRWEVETRRDHRDFHRRNSDEQKEYWSWRHNHHDDKR
jgi:hypothetical protein